VCHITHHIRISNRPFASSHALHFWFLRLLSDHDKPLTFPASVSCISLLSQYPNIVPLHAIMGVGGAGAGQPGGADSQAAAAQPAAAPAAAMPAIPSAAMPGQPTVAPGAVPMMMPGMYPGMPMPPGWPGAVPHAGQPWPAGQFPPPGAAAPAPK